MAREKSMFPPVLLATVFLSREIFRKGPGKYRSSFRFSLNHEFAKKSTKYDCRGVNEISGFYYVNFNAKDAENAKQRRGN